MNIVKTEMWPGNDHMIEYERKNTAYIVELSNGNIIDIEKPHIEKHFCFAYGYCGVSTIEDEEAANRMARQAEKDTNYFINENMKQIDHKIKALQNCIEGPDECYTYTEFCGMPEKSKLKGFTTTSLSNNPEYCPGYWSNCKDLEKLSESDIKAIISGLEEVKKSFEKRLNTYLKKYGLSKVRTWSFLSD